MGWSADGPVGGTAAGPVSDALEAEFAVWSPGASGIAAAVLLSASAPLPAAVPSVALLAAGASTLASALVLLPAFLAAAPSAVSAVSGPFEPFNGGGETSLA